MKDRLSWWLAFGNFRSGSYGLPHMGDVIAFYRKKHGETQTALATICGVDKQAVSYWENSMYLPDMDRRILLAKLLKIPPALLGLTWHSVIDEHNAEEYAKSLSHMAELVEEDAFYAYEDILLMGHEYIHNGGPPTIASRVDKRLQKLIEIVKHAPEAEREAWQSLLCRYYQLSTRIKQQCLMNKALATEHAKRAIELALNLQDVELIASSFVHSACTNHQQGKLDTARNDIAAAMSYIERLRNSPLKGNIYLESANINTPYAVSDRKLQDQCRAWQDKAANMLYKGNVEPDETFFRFNLSAVHHEKAKTLLHWQKTDEDRKSIRNKLTMALETLSPDLNVWKAYYLMTDAHLNAADQDIEASVDSAKSVLKLARVMHSKIEEANVRILYCQLHEKAPTNRYVRNLGVELGMF